ncbi:MAG: MATE family efflux transporter [Rikenellaceae bacterium]
MDILQSKEQREFECAPIGYLFRKYATPALTGLLIIGLLGIIDGAFVGNYVGSNALAALNICMPAYKTVTSLSLILGIGALTIIGTSLGQKDYAKANNALRTAFIAMSLMGLVISATLFIFMDEVLGFLGADSQIMGYARDYYSTLVPFFLVYPLWYLGDFTVKAMGRPYLSLGVMLTVVLLNILLDYVFLAHLEMGVAGAGLATGLSALVGVVSLMGFLFFSKGNMSLRKGKADFKLLPQMAYNGSSEGVSDISAGVAMLLFNRAMMEFYGADGVAALTAINYLQFIGITIFLGISDGIVPIISYNFGARNWRRIIKVVRYTFVVNFSIGLCFLLGILAFSAQLTGMLFDTNQVSTSLLELASYGAKIWALAFLFNGTNILISAYFTAISSPFRSIVIALLRGMVFITVLIFSLPALFGTDTLWFTVPLSELLALLIAIPLLRASFHPKRLKKSLM